MCPASFVSGVCILEPTKGEIQKGGDYEEDSFTSITGNWTGSGSDEAG
jgi:hypothetical protein